MTVVASTTQSAAALRSWLGVSTRAPAACGVRRVNSTDAV